VELAVAIAQVQSQVEPSLLVLDDSMGILDRERRRMMFSLLSKHSYAFQLVVASVLEPPEELGLDWLTTRFYLSQGGFIEAVQHRS
jgi:recombinational DNA repair ATPase RecF